MVDLTPTMKAIRIIIAQHLPRVPTDRATSYADEIHVNTPLSHIGLTDGAYIAATLAIERTYGFDLPDAEWEAVKTVADIAALVDRYAVQGAAA